MHIKIIKMPGNFCPDNFWLTLTQTDSDNELQKEGK